MSQWALACKLKSSQVLRQLSAALRVVELSLAMRPPLSLSLLSPKTVEYSYTFLSVLHGSKDEQLLKLDQNWADKKNILGYF